ncbi:hypothetical protein Anas_12066 [Armadillidium nasatum]|uniref:Diacylglycerol O-acyltransferase n=1 Tax=Armadillidium nasatum TaxID=96803 RepID=A0A5N5SXR0_9CRUS|nr:hypothetical protein Anas_12066 [Armadillidium nasatum]
MEGKTVHYSPGDLVQPLGSVETLMAVGGIYGTLNTIQAIWIKSKFPLEEEKILQSLWMLSRQIPHLQFCLSRRGWRLWFKRMETFNLDFEMKAGDAMEVYEDMIDSKYNLWTGPLWKVKVIVPNTNNNVNDEQYSAAVIFSLHHCMTDGTANMKICREFVKILNEINQGKINEPEINPLAPVVDKNMPEFPSITFLTKYFCTKFFATMIKNFYHKSSFAGVLPVPKTKITKTKVLYDELSKTETDILIKMCKLNDITVHSCISTIANFALLQVAQSKASYPLGVRKINVTHCVNMRRYLSPEYSDASGCHISFMEDRRKTSLKDSLDFWKEAKKTHSSLKAHLEVAKDQLRIVPLLRMASMIFPANVFLTRNGYKNKTDCHYITTNMGNLKTLLPGPEANDTVEITSVLRSVSAHLGGNPFLIAFHTFRGKFMLSLDYYTNKMTDETAHEYFTVFKTFIRNVIEYDNLHGTTRF